VRTPTDLIDRIIRENPRAAASGTHGLAHWAGVAAAGALLAASTPGADPEVIDLFAWLHDSRRENELADPRHGWRAAMYAKRLREQGAIELDSGQAYALAVALEEHDQGKVSDPRESPDQATIAVCWDADRLQLPRVGITPDPALMSTEAGRRACTQV
jgi:uncharacterized protein